MSRRKKTKRDLTFHQRVLGTLGLLFLYRLLSHVPLPFVNADVVQALISGDAGLKLFDMLTGGNLGNMSVVALGITPYITASILMQLLGVLIPSLAKMQREGSTGQKQYKRISLVLAVVLGGFQSVGMVYGYGKQGVLSDFTWYTVLIPAAIMVMGVFVLSYMGQYIDDHFFGNGISLLLACGILCSYVEDAIVLGTALTSGKTLSVSVLVCVLAALFVFFLFVFTTWLTVCEKRIPVTYATKLSGGSLKQSGEIPLKLIGGSVVPIIFASSIITFPSLIQSFFGTDVKWLRMFDMNHWLNPKEPFASAGLGLYLLLIVWFSYYYQALNLNEQEIALQLKQRGGVIPGIRPGLSTEVYLQKQMRWLTLLGGLCLCVIAVLPLLVSKGIQVSSLSFFGTSIIITVSVIYETKERYVSESQAGRYKGSLFGAKRRHMKRKAGVGHGR